MSPKHFQRHLTARTRFDVIRELTLLAARQTDLNGEHVEALAWEREQVAATGIGHGVALPHARVAGLAQPMVVVGMSDAGIDFDAPDGRLAHLVFLLLTPAEDPTAQLDLSASIAELFRDPRTLEHALRSKTYTEFLATLKVASPTGGRR
jgi:mannitol/fructose-specific phosphotransferase system IIA component (Ntr-type)